MRAHILSVSIVLSIFPVHAEALELTCPEFIQTAQQLISTPAEWQSGDADRPAILESVSLFDGPPAEMADLKPDNGDDMEAVNIIWTFGGDSSKNLWLRCNYAHTRLTLARRLPDGLASCTAHLDHNLHVSGSAVVTKVVCE